MKKTIVGAVALFAGVMTTAPGARAETPKKEGSYEYRFDDDKLLGQDIAGNVPIITPHKMGRRDRLLRPRVQFVQEMLKSVENM